MHLSCISYVIIYLHIIREKHDQYRIRQATGSQGNPRGAKPPVGWCAASQPPPARVRCDPRPWMDADGEADKGASELELGTWARCDHHPLQSTDEERGTYQFVFQPMDGRTMHMIAPANPIFCVLYEIIHGIACNKESNIGLCIYGNDYRTRLVPWCSVICSGGIWAVTRSRMPREGMLAGSSAV